MGKGGYQRTRDRMEEAETVGPEEGEVHEKPKKTCPAESQKGQEFQGITED